ncbi:hypothetical protein [Nocardia wallacei]|uniref:hypothetical protein n=1 Tax=Nocardia wallacei TaxID=480035 RepID=UPI0024560BDF|nr:hypothetical protein [Nocardia wallacei]
MSATPPQLRDLVIQYLSGLSDSDYRAIADAARAPAAPTGDTAHRITPEDAREAVRRRHGRVNGEEVN